MSVKQVAMVSGVVVLIVIVGVVIAIAVNTSRGGNAAAPPSGTGTGATGTGETVAFYGDSYTLGTGASDLCNRWSTVVSAERNWREVNPSVNGLGFVNNRSAFDGNDLPEAIIASDPDIVFVTMGLNDNFSFASRSEQIEQQITDDLTRLKRALPDARFIVVEPFWYTDERPESVETIIGWVAAAAAAIDADYIAGASRWIEGHPEWMASDGLHPNDEGYAEMAKRMDEELRALGL
ncbi:SGNH/GDSL hydrolase family protein [Glaciihabitans tibetensis]|nr:SGNH/GDSL hydrolase family protein [Glaciihabitans tibetensis]